MIHIMLDLETWGTTPGCDIRSIGACVFDPVRGKVADQNTVRESDFAPFGTFYVACDNSEIDLIAYRQQHGWDKYIIHRDKCGGVPRKYPLTRDPRTVQWWSEQSDEAQAAFADPVDLREALERFNTWYQALEQSTPYAPRLWSHGSHFDVPILAAAYEAVDLPVPWHYRAPRDTRTIFDAAGIDDHSAWLKQHPGPLGVSHHALDDAICQARAVCAAYDRMYRICHAGDRWTPVEAPYGTHPDGSPRDVTECE